MPIIKVPYTQEGEKMVENIKENVEEVGGEIDYGQNNVTDAPSMIETSYAGGGETGYNKIGMYKKGGPVMDIPGEQVKWATEVTPPKKKEKKDKKPGFFSKEKRAERKVKRAERKADAIKKSAEARKENKKAGVKTGEMKVPGGQVKWATDLEKQKTKRKEIKEASKKMAKKPGFFSKEKRDERKAKRKDKKPRVRVKTPEMVIPKLPKWGKKKKKSKGSTRSSIGIKSPDFLK